MNCGVNSILIDCEKGDRGLTGATGATGPTGSVGIGVAYSVKKLFLEWKYPFNGSTNSGSLISITYADFNNAVFSDKVYNKNLSIVSTVNYFSNPVGMLMSKIDIYVYDPVSSKYFNVSTFFRPTEIEYMQGGINISLGNAVTRINNQIGLSISSMDFLISIMG